MYTFARRRQLGKNWPFGGQLVVGLCQLATALPVHGGCCVAVGVSSSYRTHEEQDQELGFW